VFSGYPEKYPKSAGIVLDAKKRVWTNELMKALIYKAQMDVTGL
jgi:hypothetical protein